MNIIAASLFASAAATVANAADAFSLPASTAADNSGWYLRGDVGYSFESSGSGRIRVEDPDLGLSTSIPFDRLLQKWKHDGNLGVGYQFNAYLRGDLTVGHSSRSVEGRSHYDGVNDWTYDQSSDLDIWEIMANAYVDIGQYGLFTPYVGGGVGLALLDYGQMTNEASCACGEYTGYHSGLSSNRFAWALMAGTAVNITPNLKLDVGYRYSRIEGGKAYGWDQFDRAGGLSGTQISDNGFDTHQIRAGLRYQFF